MTSDNIQAGDTISFVTHSDMNAPRLTGVVQDTASLWLIVYVDYVQYELRKLIDIQKIVPKKYAVSIYTDTPNKGVQVHVRLYPTIELATEYFDQGIKKMEGWIRESIEQSNVFDGADTDDLLEYIRENCEDVDYDKTTGYFYYEDHDGTTYVMKLTDMQTADVIDIFS